MHFNGAAHSVMEATCFNHHAESSLAQRRRTNDLVCISNDISPPKHILTLRAHDIGEGIAVRARGNDKKKTHKETEGE